MRKKVKKQIGKEEAKLVDFSLLVDDMVLYTRDSQNSTRELLETSNTFSKTAAHKNQPTKFNSIFVYQSQKCWNREHGNIPVHNSL